MEINLNKNNNVFFYIILSIIFFISILNSLYQFKNFDKYSISKNSAPRHQLINGDIGNFWLEGNDIVQQLNEGKNYFETGGEYRRPYLPSRLFALYSFITSEKLVDDNNLVIVGGKKILYLFFQSIVFYLLLFFLYKKIINHFPKLTSQIIVLFLAFEPTIFMYHSSYWSESIFFSMILFFVILILDNNYSYKNLFFIGLTLGILYLQRSVAIFYIFPIFIYFFYDNKKFFLRSIFLVSLGYLMIHLFVGYHNYKRVGIFYSTSTQAKDGFYIYLSPQIVSKNLKINNNEAMNLLNQKKQDWVADNKIDLNLESDRLKYYDFQKNEAFKIFLQNPINSLSVIGKNSLHFLVIDPLTHVYYFHKWNYDKGHFYKSKEHQKWKIPRIIYSILIYYFCIYGLIVLYRNKKDRNFLLFITLSIFYFMGVQSWYGGTRYFAPILIFLSFLFGNGLSFFIQKKHFK